MGAHRAWMVSAATDVVKAGAAVCWMNTTDSLMTLTNNQNKGGSAYSMIIPEYGIGWIILMWHLSPVPNRCCSSMVCGTNFFL